MPRRPISIALLGGALMAMLLSVWFMRETSSPPKPMHYTSSPPPATPPPPTGQATDPVPGEHEVAPDAQSSPPFPGTISGILTDAHGVPAVGISLYASLGIIATSQVLTGNSGNFEITALGPGRYAIFARLQQNAQESQLLDEVVLSRGENRTGLHLVLPERLLSIGGTVVDSLGAPIPDALVFLQHRGGGELAEGRSDASGVFEVDGLPSGAYDIQVAHEVFGGRVDIRAEAGVSDLVIVLEERGGVEGFVELADGSPATTFRMAHVTGDLAGARLIYGPKDELVFQHEEGYFLLEGISPGPHTLLVRAPGHLPTMHVVPAVVPAEITSAGSIRLQEGAELSGQVFDPAGKPLAEVEIKAGDRPVNEKTLHTTVSAFDGSFSLEGLPEGRKHLQAAHPDFATYSEVVTLAVDEPTVVAIHLGHGGQLRGRVTSEGKVIAGAHITVHLAERKEALTDLSGEYAIARLPEGIHRVSARMPDGSTGSAPDQTLDHAATILPHETTELDFDFTPISGSAKIAGTVTVAGQLPGDEGRVTARFPPIEAEWTARVNSQGRFLLEELPAGRGWLNIHFEFGPGISRTLAIHTTEGKTLQLPIEMQAGAHLAGTLTGMLEGELATVVIFRGTHHDRRADEAATDIVNGDDFGPIYLEEGSYTLLAYTVVREPDGLKESRYLTRQIVMHHEDVVVEIALEEALPVATAPAR